MRKLFIKIAAAVTISLAWYNGKAQCSFCFLTGPAVSGQQGDCSVIISWTTDTQTPSMSYFSIQRSNDGNTSTFVQIGTIPGSPGNSSILPYSFTDTNPFSTGAAVGSRVYYRVKAVRNDGTGQYSNIIASPILNTTCAGGGTNPCSTYLVLSGNGLVCGTSQNYTLTVGSGPMDPGLITWSLQAPVIGSGYTLPFQNVCTMTTAGNQATLTKVANGNIWLVAKVNGCPYLATSKEVTFGVSPIANNGAYAPNISNQWYTTITSTVHFTPGTLTAISMANPSNNTYTFTQSAGSSSNASVVYWGNGNVGASFARPVNSSSHINLSVQTSNACGTSGSTLVLYYNGTPLFRSVVSPNPVSDVLTLQYDDQSLSDMKKLNDRIKSVQIISKSGLVVLKKTGLLTGKRVSIDVSGLRPDIYTLVINYATGTEQHKISVIR